MKRSALAIEDEDSTPMSAGGMWLVKLPKDLGQQLSALNGGAGGGGAGNNGKMIGEVKMTGGKEVRAWPSPARRQIGFR